MFKVFLALLALVAGIFRSCRRLVTHIYDTRLVQYKFHGVIFHKRRGGTYRIYSGFVCNGAFRELTDELDIIIMAANLWEAVATAKLFAKSVNDALGYPSDPHVLIFVTDKEYSSITSYITISTGFLLPFFNAKKKAVMEYRSEGEWIYDAHALRVV